MPIPKFMAQINKRTFNKLELKRGVRPFLTHVGRNSGKVYRVPLDAHAVDGGYVFFANYGSQSDWVQNILAAGSARLTVGGEEFDLVTPRILTTEEAWQQLPESTKRLPDFLNITEYLRMDIAA